MIAVYSPSGGTGKSTLASEIATQHGMTLVPLDPQDGGDISNVDSAPDNAVLDCPPWRKSAIAALSRTDRLIYIVRAQDESRLVPCLNFARDELYELKATNPSLQVYLKLSHHQWTKESQHYAIEFLTALDFVNEYSTTELFSS